MLKLTLTILLLASSLHAQGFLVTWQPNAPEDNIDYYCLYRDGELIATEYDTCFTDTTLTPNQWHDYYVRAVSVSGVKERSNRRRGIWLSWNGELNNDMACYLDSMTIVFDLPPGGIESVDITITAGVVTMRSVYDINKDGKIGLGDLGALVESGTIPEGFIELYGKNCIWEARK